MATSPFWCKIHYLPKPIVKALQLTQIYNKEVFKMKLREAIKDFPGDEWLDISEVKINKPSHIGRITKELLRGKVLNREVVRHLSNIESPERGYSIHRFYIAAKQKNS